MEHLEYYLMAGTVIPLVAFVFLAFFGHRIGKPAASWPAIIAIVLSFLLSSYVLMKWQGYSPAEKAEAQAQAFDVHWATLGEIPINAGVQLDSLTIAMYFMVTLIASCIFIFARGYMAGHSDEVDHTSKYHRFFTYLSLFAFSMLGLVLSNTLFFMFMFWELVGVCSYFLIGFYFDKKFATNASMKAFITNRVGDFGFIIGLAIVASYFGTLSIDGAAEVFRSQWQAYTSGVGDAGIFESVLNVFGWEISGVTIATFMGICLFCGCLGKSAQVPLQVWLPDAMAGPTPVSALIHAATMVAAGVYLVARVFPLLTPDAQAVIAVIGCITLTMAALIAIVQTDIKKVLAYSTLSQLGYMVFGLGVGAWVGALFHLITHAFFKAMMFLGSGQVIEGCHHVQDIRRMGGLRTKMPITCWTFFVGVLAIAGFGIPSLNTTTFAGLGGYYSKDEILAVAYYRVYGAEDAESHDAGHDAEHVSLVGPGVQLASYSPADPAGEHGPDDHANNGHGASTHFEGLVGSEQLPMLPKWLFWLPVIIAYVTPFYMMRVWWLTFMGKPRDVHVHEEAHESPLMKWPLVVLAVGTFFSSWFLFRPLIADAAPAAAGFATQMVLPLDGHEHALHGIAGPALTWIVGFAFLVGFAVAIAVYRNGLGVAETIMKVPGVKFAHKVLEHKFYFDEVYNTVLVGGTRTLAWLSAVVDKWGLDYSIIENLARLVKGCAFFSGRTLDARGVDKVAEGMGQTAFDIGDFFRAAQTGRIRNYVIFSAGATAMVVIGIIWRFSG
jgi:NADH-quinone oxidoreductase subunit L